MIGLALEGGGAKGSYQVGAYFALKKCHVKIDAVTGTSIGSLNGAFIAAHDEKKMLKLWREATMESLLGIDDAKIDNIIHGSLNLNKIKDSASEINKIIKNKGLDMSKYRNLIKENLSETKIRNSNIKYGLTTVKAKGFKPVEIFIEDIPNGKLEEYIVASSFLPGFKKEKLIDNSNYLDGGFYNLSPVDMLIDIGCDTIYVINIKGIGFRKPVKKNKKVKIIEIKPYDNLGSIIYFNKKTSENNITRGYYDTLRLFGKIDGNRYYIKRHSNFYYRRLNHKVENNIYEGVSKLLNSKNEKDTVIKALEYIISKEKMPDLELYTVNEIIELAKSIKTKNVIYRYVKLLGVW